MAQKVKGLDVGTMNLVGATQNERGETKIKLIRHTFLDIDINPYTKKMLQQQKVKYAEIGKKVYVLGDEAFELANIMNKTVRRPMQSGVISPEEADAIPIFALLIEAVLGKSSEKDEICFYSAPADPIDADFNVVYHSSIIEGALKSLGYLSKPVNEGHAIVFSELGPQDFTGIGISCGGGMFNICVSYKTIPTISFATSRAGDWVDSNVARVLGVKINRVTAIKEKGLNIRNPRNREEEAIVIYYRNLISYTLANIKDKFEKAEQVPQFPDPVDIVCAGGSALIKGFIEVFKDELKRLDFPIPINEVRLAEEPLYAAAKGCLLAGLTEVS